MDKAQQDALKKAAGIEAAKLVENGMIAGLGTGSTVKFLVDELGRRHQEEGLEFTGVTTSRRTQAQAESYGIKIVDIDDVDHIDVTIDGADEVDPAFNVIKGGGGALLREKIVAQASRRFVIVVDERKLSPQLGVTWPVPIEVMRYGYTSQVRFLESLGGQVNLRLATDGSPYVTDNGNWIIDCRFAPIADPDRLAHKLEGRAGVVEHGLFLHLATDLVVAGTDGIRYMPRP